MIQMVETQYQIQGMTQMVEITLAHQKKQSILKMMARMLGTHTHCHLISIEKWVGLYNWCAKTPWREACNPNNTLKDATEIEWVHSPSQTTATSSTPHYHHVLTQKWVHGDNEESTDEDDTNEHPKWKRKVMLITLLMLYFLTVSPDLPQQTWQVTHCDSDDKVPRNDEDEGDTKAKEMYCILQMRWQHGRGFMLCWMRAVWNMCMTLFLGLMSHDPKINLPWQTSTVTQKCLNTHDVCLCFREAVQVIDDKEITGYYCVLCLM